MTKKLLSIIRVKGKSMLPYYRDGDYLIITRIFFSFFLKKNSDVVFEHDEIGLMVKRVDRVDKVKKIIRVFGTGPETLKSNKIGDIRFNKILGIVFFKI